MKLLWRFPRVGAERRAFHRVSVKLDLNERIGDRSVRSLALDVSEQGLSVHRPDGPESPPDGPISLELALPGAGRPIRAEAEPQFQCVQRGISRTGLRFVAMAPEHRRVLVDFLADRRLRELEPRPPRRWLERLGQRLLRDVG